MTQEERLDFLIDYLLREQPEYKNISVPTAAEDKRRLLRSLMNVRPPVPAGGEYLKIQESI